MLMINLYPKENICISILAGLVTMNIISAENLFRFLVKWENTGVKI